MADPFEVRLRFTNLLTHLTASTTSSMKTASFALKHRDMDEDLHSCILESLEAPTTSMNSRANIMYFLEHFCDMAVKENHGAYVEMVQRDMTKIVAAVVGKNNAAGANVKVARKVVGDLERRGWLKEEIVRVIEEDLKRREADRSSGLLGEEGGGGGAEELEKRGGGGEKERRVENSRDKKDMRQRDGKSNGVNKVDKRAIEQRIEEDRERNKRLRESVWAVNGDDEEEELNRLWEETSDLCEDDYAIAREEAEERAQFARYHRMLLQEGR